MPVTERQRQSGFTLLHLAVTTAAAAYALGFSIPVEVHRAGVERGVMGAQAGVQSLASAARAHFRTEGEWPTLAEAQDAIATGTGSFFPDRHPLGGTYVLAPRTAAGANWRAGGLSIGACGITAAQARQALAARLGHRAAIAGNCVRWEVPPFGEELTHLDSRASGGGRLFADLGIAGGSGSHAPAPWTGGLRAESNVALPGNPPDFQDRVVLGSDGNLLSRGMASSGGASFGTARPSWVATPPHNKPLPYPSGPSTVIVSVDGDLMLSGSDPTKGRIPGNLAREVDWDIEDMYALDFCWGTGTC